MRKTALALLAFGMLSLGCVHRTVLPDPSIPHRLAREAKVQVYVRAPDGTLIEQKVRILPGWYVVSPEVAGD